MYDQIYFLYERILAYMKKISRVYGKKTIQHKGKDTFQICLGV